MDAIAARQIASGSNNGAAATNDPVVGKAASKAANSAVPKVFTQSIGRPHQPAGSARSRWESVLLSLIRLEAESVCVHIRRPSHRNALHIPGGPQQRRLAYVLATTTPAAFTASTNAGVRRSSACGSNISRCRPGRRTIFRFEQNRGHKCDEPLMYDCSLITSNVGAARGNGRHRFKAVSRNGLRRYFRLLTRPSGLIQCLAESIRRRPQSNALSCTKTANTSQSM